ncbi:hypothetical protein [Streptomyces zingiberis]|uniref:Uncharacterized protein n=1 Tax=Streptomyces zingiberis TaxID=2053010 RepID=A0ABX1C0I4_9ACTN|nr:hypothetical protein [Streptomyces zingiberis]NJQ01645.1 hypothetical protein [Streptomyces zingiberis]
MSHSRPPVPVRPEAGRAGHAADHANAAIRAFVAGRTSWSAADLAELDRLRTRWRLALRHEITEAA